MVEFFQKKKVFLVVIFIFVVTFIGIISAEFQLGGGGEDYFIEEIYGPGFDLTGWINISFSEESLESNMEDNFGNSIILKELLEENPSYVYSCDPAGCGEDYSSSNGETTKIINIDSGNEELVGFLLAGEIVSINSVTFDIESDGNENSCTSPLKLDFSDDGIVEVWSENVVDKICSSEEEYGCFDLAQLSNVEEFNLVSNGTYCQRIDLPESSGFRIGAWIKKLSGSGNLTMSLYKNNGVEVANCALPPITSGKEYFCDVNYSTSEGDHYVCVSSKMGNGNHNVRGSNSEERCGFFGEPVKSEFASYQIFARSKKFGIPGNQQVNNDLGGKFISLIIENYLTEKYGAEGGFIQCSEGCVVPLKIISEMNQEITLKNLLINYEKQGGIVVSDKFYNVAKVPAKISSNFQKLSLDKAKFALPKNLGNYSFSLSLAGSQVFSEDIEIKNAPIINSIKPLGTASAYPTEFEVEVSNSSNAKKYEWDFGDGSFVETTTQGKITHVYSSIGIYNLKVTVTDSKDVKSSKTFSINVISPKNLIKNSLEELNLKVEKAKTDIDKLDLFHKQGILSVLDLDSIESNIGLLQNKFDSAISEEEYNSIIIELVEIEVPGNIVKTVSAKDVSFFNTPENIELDILEQLGEGSYGSDEEAYQNYVLFWQNENVNVKMDFNEFSDEEAINPLIKIFDIEISEKSPIGYDYFLVVPDLENLQFKDNIQVRESGYSYVLLNGDSKVSFYTTEDVDFTNLPIFIAPPIGRLSVIDNFLVGGERESRSKLIVALAVILLAVLSFIVYIIMQEWYKRKYENYLFKNKNDLYNMVHYVNSAKRKGLKKKDIEKNLRKSGWSSEKVNFVVKKYAGKRTGMLEIPVGKIIDKFSKNSDKKTTK